MSKNLRLLMKILSVLGLVLTVVYMVWLWKQGILTDEAKMHAYISDFGMAGALVFILIQIVQVVIPIIPGGISCAAGVAFYGTVMGFVYNYVGICIGSVLVFLIAKKYGRGFIRLAFEERLVEKYEKWTEENNRFAKLFAIAIASPVAPDDFLCYLAGTTQMKLSTFTWIILLCKPFTIIVYGTGLHMLIQMLLKGGM